MQGYQEARLPLEVVWSDIDYLDGFRDFTFDPQGYAVDEMRKFVEEELHSQDKKWIPIIDPGIKVEPGYAPYEAGRVATERPGATPDERVFIVVDKRGGSDDNDSSSKNSSTSPLPPLVAFVGTVWPGRVNYPDFLSLAARDFWLREIESLHALVPFDGLWIDMSEPSNFDDDQSQGGDERGKEREREGDVPPLYPINNGGRRDPLSAKTVSIWARGASGKRRGGGGDASSLSSSSDSSSGQRDDGGASSSRSSDSDYGSSAFHIDTHNLYGHAEASATWQSLVKVLTEARAKKQKKKMISSSPLLPPSSSSPSSLSPPTPPPPTARPFILARSSFLGLGSFAAHWTGDNAATWRDLGWSVSGIFNSGLFASAALSGADVCGFSLDTTPELCSRWVAAAAFQPFWRSHSDKSARPQEPYLWPSVADAARPALGARYRLLPMLYSGLALSAETGAPLMRPLWYEWPGEEMAHESDRSWVLAGGGEGGVGGGGVGPGRSSTSAAAAAPAPLFVAPPLHESDSDSVTTWLPPGKWFDLWGLLEDALGLELEVEPPSPPRSSQSSQEEITIASFDGGEHGVAGFSLPCPTGRAVALLQRQGSIVPLAWSPSSNSSSLGKTEAETEAEKDNPLLSVAAALRAPLALSVALECSSNSTFSSCYALGTLFVDDGETDSRGDWWLLRASVGERGGRVDAELLSSSGGGSSPSSSSSSSSSSSGAAAAALVLRPRHPPPRLRKISISVAGEEMQATVISGNGTLRGVAASDLGVVVAAVVVPSSSSSSSASAITFELPETPSFFDVGRGSTSGAASPVMLVSWGDGGGRGSVAEA